MIPPAIQMTGIDKRFGAVHANRAVDLTVTKGTVHGLIGENGAGKSTLCSMLAGLYRPDSGHILLDGEELHLRSPDDAAAHGIGMVYQHFRLVDSFTVAENIVLGHRAPGSARASGRRARRELDERVAQLADDYGLEVHPTAPVWQLSVGERQRVEILKQLYRGARILILDEPTAVLAPHESDRLFEAVRRMVETGHAVVLVSHKMQEILGHTDRVTVLRSGRNVGEGATDTLTPAMLATMMFGGTHVPDDDIAHEPNEPGEPVLVVDGLRVAGDHGRAAVDGVTVTVRRHEIVGVAGVAGNGQRELHEAIAGLRPFSDGSITIDGHECSRTSPRQRHEAGLAYVPEDRLGTGLAPGLTIEHNIALRSFARRPHSRAGWLNTRAIEATSSRLVADFDVRGARPGMPVSFMSGGNLQKAILARELTEHHEVLVAAAPTRGLDIAAAAAVRTQLRAERDGGRGVLLFSEDLAEVLELSDVVVVMFKGRVVGTFDRAGADPERIGLLMSGALDGSDGSSSAGDTGIA